MDKLEFTDLLRAGRGAKECRINMKLAVVGNASTQHLSAAIKGYGAIAGIGIDIYDAGYRQEKALILNPESDLYRFLPDAIFLYCSSETLYKDFINTDRGARGLFAENKVREIEALYESIGAHNIKILQNSIPEFNDNVFGAYSLKIRDSFAYQIKRLNFLLMERMEKHPDVFPVDLCSLSSRIGRNNYFNGKMYIMGELTIALGALPSVAKAVVDVLLAIYGKIRKCIILDLDNTLWGGVVGDDGIENIQVGELGAGKAFSHFQQWLKELKERGILLAVASKNDEKTAKEPFLKHPDMVLSLDDFVAFTANWENKADNIKKIQNQLNIGMDSIVFIDDSKFERETVKSLIPDIEVPDLPEDPCNYVEFLSSRNYFETVSYSLEDASRTKQYREEADRKREEAGYSTYEQYLEGLDMAATVKDFDLFHVPRIAQLSQRSNQFNFRTVRMTEGDVKALMGNGHFITKYFELKDKFGGYGLVGYVVLEKRGNRLYISNWVMSCRVLKRTMEEFIMNHIMSIAGEAGMDFVVGEYIPTEKNVLVKDLYSGYGFTPEPGGAWLKDTGNYVELETYIKETEAL